MIKGSIVALVSPMFEDGTIDYDSYRNLIEMHIAAGTNAIVAVGTTGESPTVDYDEHNELVRVAVETAAGRIPVIAGTGSNSTKPSSFPLMQLPSAQMRHFKLFLITTSRHRKVSSSISKQFPMQLIFLLFSTTFPEERLPI